MNIYTERKILMKACEAVSLFFVMYMSKQWFEYVEKKNYYHFLFYFFADALYVSDGEEVGIKRHEYECEKGFSSIYSDQERAAVDQSIFIVM